MPYTPPAVAAPVTSVAGRTGVVTLTEADIASLVADLAAKAAKASNLNDLADAAAARTNLGLGALATRAAPSLGIIPCNSDLARFGDSGQAVGTALVPSFYPIMPAPGGLFTVSQMMLKVTTAVAASSAGMAIYSIAYSGSQTFTATLLAMLNADIDTSANGVKKGDITVGAFGSGAGTLALDFTSTLYVVGMMGSTVTTLKFAGAGINAGAGSGAFVFSGSGGGAARANVHDWPSSFVDTAVATGGNLTAVSLVNAAGKNWR